MSGRRRSPRSRVNEESGESSVAIEEKEKEYQEMDKCGGKRKAESTGEEPDRKKIVLQKAEYDPLHPFTSLPLEISNLILSLLDQIDIYMFAGTSLENQVLALALAHNIDPVVVYTLEERIISTSMKSAYFDCMFRNQNVDVEEDKGDAGNRDLDVEPFNSLSALARLLRSNTVKRLEIDLTDCGVDKFVRMAETLRLALISAPRRTLDVIVIKTNESSSALMQCDDSTHWDKWQRVFASLSEVLPTRRLSFFVKCRCESNNCSFVAQHIYSYWKRLNVLEGVAGWLHPSWDLWGVCPRLKGVANHNQLLTPHTLLQLGFLQTIIQKWRGGCERGVFWMAEWCIEETTLRADARFKRCEHNLAPYYQKVEVRDDFCSVTYYVRRAADTRCLVVEQFFFPDRFIVECYEKEEEESIYNEVWYE